ncbi:hypothetical protein [Paracoccus aminovorans]|uniref:hypothetical protein n=1 Tax=Paracoccus aminovorans TaxID=34004 RepID=UPI00078194BD|nr:hypothetical protein [Paracoccus aminovorans]
MTADNTTAPERIWACVEPDWEDGDGNSIVGGKFEGYDLTGKGVPYVRADLCASGQVRALEWEEYGPDCFFGRGECGDYSIATSASCFHEGEFRLCGVEGDFSYFDTAEAAKAAAQADYERRILAAMTPAPQPDGQECSRCGAVGGFGCYECTPETPTAQEAVAVMWRARRSESEEWQHFTSRPSWWEVQPLYAHPPQPIETVAEAISAIEALSRSTYSCGSQWVRLEDAIVALRALKGSDK